MVLVKLGSAESVAPVPSGHSVDPATIGQFVGAWAIDVRIHPLLIPGELLFSIPGPP